MAAQSPFALQNGSHSAALFRQAAYSPYIGGGPIGTGDYAVTAQGTPNMSVQVAAGRAWIPGSQVANVSGGTFSTQAGYFAINDAPATVTISTANATNPRIDVVYVAVQDSFYSGTNNVTVLGVVTGTPAASPTAPSAPSNSLVVAQVAVAANATSITSGSIASTRTRSQLYSSPFLCTSSTQPTAYWPGQPIYETDTGVVKVGGGSAFYTVGGALPAASLYQATAQTGLASGWAGITFDSEYIDTNGTHSGSSGTFTVPAGHAGNYEVEGGVVFGSGATGIVNARILHNGAVFAGSTGASFSPGFVGASTVTGGKLLALAAGDTVSLQGYSATGPWNTAVFTDGACWLRVQRVS